MKPIERVTGCFGPSVHAVFTRRSGGVSLPPFDSFNLGDHVGDSTDAVSSNRQLLAHKLGLKSIQWLSQVHGARVINDHDWQPGIEADAITTKTPGFACAVLTADCLPILLANHQGSQVAAIHGGWRSLAAGIIANTVACFDTNDSLSAYLGPAIGPKAFEVGPEVREQFVALNPLLVSAFTASQNPGHYYANIYQIATQELQSLGVHRVYGGTQCTLTQSNDFFSYRRERQTGRQASLLWIDF